MGDRERFIFGRFWYKKEGVHGFTVTTLKKSERPRRQGVSSGTIVQNPPEFRSTRTVPVTVVPVGPTPKIRSKFAAIAPIWQKKSEEF